MPAILALLFFASPVAPWFAAFLGALCGIGLAQEKYDGAIVFGMLALVAALYSSYSSATMMKWLSDKK
jgi:Na+-translocating ferredoxin:NAD+ oxidoreductase RnfD subunit